MLTSSLKAEEKLNGSQTPAVASSLIDAGMALLCQGDAQGAEAMYRQALAIRKQKYPASHLAVINAQARLGEALLVQGKDSEAEAVLTQAAGSIQTSSVALPPWQIAEVRSTLAICIAALGGTRMTAEEVRPEMDMLRTDPRPLMRKDPRVRIANLVRVWKERAHHGKLARVTPAPPEHDAA